MLRLTHVGRLSMAVSALCCAIAIDVSPAPAAPFGASAAPAASAGDTNASKTRRKQHKPQRKAAPSRSSRPPQWRFR